MIDCLGEAWVHQQPKSHKRLLECTPRSKFEGKELLLPPRDCTNTVLPFGLHGTPATFQKLVDRVQKSHREHAATYLDDVVIQSDGTATGENDRDVRGLFAANPMKCKLGLEELLHFHLGHLADTFVQSDLQ